jgi:hypothetical protein
MLAPSPSGLAPNKVCSKATVAAATSMPCRLRSTCRFDGLGELGTRDWQDPTESTHDALCKDVPPESESTQEEVGLEDTFDVVGLLSVVVTLLNSAVPSELEARLLDSVSRTLSDTYSIACLFSLSLLVFLSEQSAITLLS